MNELLDSRFNSGEIFEMGMSREMGASDGIA